MEELSTDFPDDYIECIGLSNDDLKNTSYSLSVARPELCQEGTLWHTQVDQYRQYKLNPPVGSGKMGKCKASTVADKLRAAHELAGYCCLFAGVETPSFEITLQPELIAKFYGYHVKRGISMSTIKSRIDIIRGLSEFAASKWCTKDKAWPSDYLDAVGIWYKDLVKKLRLECEAVRDAKRSNAPEMHLQEAWEYATSEWIKFTEEFKVGWAFSLGHAGLHFTFCLPVQANNKSWTPQLANKCQSCLIRLLLCGVYQPPVRVGSLHYCMPSTAQGTVVEGDCICPECSR